MSAAKITISLSPDLLRNLDRLVSEHVFESRSQAIQSAVGEKLQRLSRSRLTRECAKLDPVEEQQFAELGLESEIDQWPRY